MNARYDEDDETLHEAGRFGFSALQEAVHQTALDAGWHTDRVTGRPINRNIGESIALMHSELSEALEADRRNLMDDKLPHRRGIEVELADCVIRSMDLSAHLGLDLVGAIIEKNAYNRHRADHKIENRNKDDGKKY